MKPKAGALKRSVLLINFQIGSTSYVVVFICQNSLNCTLLMGEFYCLCIIPKEQTLHKG